LPIHDELRLILKETFFRDNRNFSEALKLNDIRLSKARKGTPEYALVTFYRALAYRDAGNIEQEKYYLALSAISDIESANKDHASLFMLAAILFDQGDIERSSNYIRFSWNETVFYNARLRSLQSASILSLIDKTYQAKIENQKSKLQINLILISVLVIIMVFIAFNLNRQIKRSSALQKNLQKANIQLEKINDELNQLNEQLKSANMDLSEANKIKEEYIGRFIKLCSTYIDKLDNYRRMINKKISSGQTAEVLKITRSQDILEKEFEELYANFDRAFLQIFPDFISKVNDLLHEEDKIVLKRGELFTTELRILALIRLGIHDSQQIADFLRYSVNTIYNYRAKIKNRASVVRNDFESLIMLIR
jgi:cell division protein FtsB